MLMAENPTLRTSATKSRWREMLVSVVLIGAVAFFVIAIWQWIVVRSDLPKMLLPSPMEVLRTAWLERQTLSACALVTATTAIISLIVALLLGGSLSILFSQSSAIRRAVFPYVVFLQTVPIVAIAPLLVTWSGYNFRSAVIATVVICLFPIINNTTTGLLTIRREHEELFRLYGAGRIQRMLSLQIPGAVPSIMLGLRISSGLAVIGAIVAEFFVSNGASNYNGLGALMTGWQTMGRTDALMSALFASAAVGLLLFGLVQLVTATALRRWTRIHER